MGMPLGASSLIAETVAICHCPDCQPFRSDIPPTAKPV
jgi:hypothetical protein